MPLFLSLFSPLFLLRSIAWNEIKFIDTIDHSIEDTIDSTDDTTIKDTANNNSKNDDTKDFAIDYVDNQNVKCGTDS